MLDFTGYSVPDHTQVALEMFILHGIPPGSFLTSVLTNDLFGAFSSADYQNRDRLEDIVKWLQHKAPLESYGSRAKIAAWITDADNIRKKYAEHVEKMYIWRSLKKVG